MTYRGSGRAGGNGPRRNDNGPQGNPLGARCFFCPASNQKPPVQIGYLTLPRDVLEEIGAWIWLNRGSQVAHKFWAALELETK